MLEFYGNSYTVHFLGCIDEKDIKLVYSHVDKKLSREARDLIEKRWQEHIENDAGAYDGDLVEFISIEKSGDGLILYYDYTKYRYTLTCRRDIYKPFIEQGNYVSNHIAIPTVIRTTDNKILIGSDLKKINNLPKWKFPGGYWEKADGGIVDNIKRECCEEIGYSEFLNVKIIGIESCKNMTCITAFAEVNMTSEELAKYIQNNKANAVDSSEMAEIRFLDFNESELNHVLADKTITLGIMGAISIYNLIQYLKR